MRVRHACVGEREAGIPGDGFLAKSDCLRYGVRRIAVARVSLADVVAGFKIKLIRFRALRRELT